VEDTATLQTHSSVSLGVTLSLTHHHVWIL